MDPATAAHVYRRLALFDLVQDIRIGLNLAFYRTFAVPRIAELLAATGEIHRRPHKRSIDTGLLMYELIEAGFDGDRGRAVVRELNRMHGRWDIAEEDYRYVLTTFIVVPTRWVGEYGPRLLTERELEATVIFYRELGRRMNIRSLPATYTEAEAIFDAYERDYVGYSPAGERLMRDTRDVMAEQLPWPLKPAAPLFTRLILDDDIARAVGLPPAPIQGRLLMHAVALLRVWTNPLRRLRRSSYFTPGRPVPGVYPDGYAFAELGVPAPVGADGTSRFTADPGKSVRAGEDDF